MLNHLTGLQQSAPVQFLGQHWFEEVSAENKPGASWQKIQQQGDFCHLHLRSGDLYRDESASWVAVKTLGMLWFGGYYYFGAAFIRHLGSGVIKGALAAREVFWNGRALQNEAQFKWTTHVKGSSHTFSSAYAEFVQAGKDFLCLAPFYLNAFYITTIFTYTATLYTFYNPLEPRVMLEAVQNWWRPKGAKPLTDAEVANLTVWDTVAHLTNGSYSLTQLFKSNVVGKKEVPLVKEADVTEEEEKKTK